MSFGSRKLSTELSESANGATTTTAQTKRPPSCEHSRAIEGPPERPAPPGGGRSRSRCGVPFEARVAAPGARWAFGWERRVTRGTIPRSAMASFRRSHAVIVLVALGAVWVIAGAVSEVSGLGSARSGLVATAERLDVAHPALVRAVRRADDPDRARILVARSLLYEALDPGAGAESSAGDLRLARLAAANGLARKVLAERPASWEAATVAGAATYLSWSLTRDPRLLQEYRRWEEPLSLALRLAPAELEPTRYLATAYLELWPALSDAKRDLARRLLAGAFTDPRTFDRLIEPWIDLAGTHGDALAPVPDAPWAWQRVRLAMARRSDWEDYCRSWDREREALRHELASRLAAADRDLAAEHLLAARQELLSVAADSPPDRAFAPLVDRAMRTAPYGPIRQEEARPMIGWLDWAQELRLNGETPFSAAAIARLSSAIAPEIPAEGPDAAIAAWASLVAGRRERPEQSVTRTAASWSESWAPYLLEKASRLIEQGDYPGAGEELDRVHPDWRSHPAYLAARLELARAEGDGAATTEAKAALDAVRATAGRPSPGRSTRPPRGWSSWRESRPPGSGSASPPSPRAAPPSRCAGTAGPWAATRSLPARRSLSPPRSSPVLIFWR